MLQPSGRSRERPFFFSFARREARVCGTAAQLRRCVSARTGARRLTSLESQMSSTSQTRRLRRCRKCDHRSPYFEPRCPSCGARLRPPVMLFVMLMCAVVLAVHFVHQI
jgi:uncharacterized paraquat-inducible protein A